MSSSLTAVAERRRPVDTTDRILDAALDLVGTWGIGKTTLADLARASGCSRATIYRSFPGGRDDVFARLAEREIGVFIRGVASAVESADDLAGALTRALVVAARQLSDHRAVGFVLEHESEFLVPYFSFRRVEVVYSYVADLIGPLLEAYLPAETAAWAAEWSARVFFSYMFVPDDGVDLAQRADAARIVDTYLMPSLTPSLIS